MARRRRNDAVEEENEEDENVPMAGGSVDSDEDPDQADAESDDESVSDEEIGDVHIPTGKDLFVRLLTRVGVDNEQAEAIALVAGVTHFSDLADLKEDHISQIAKTANSASMFRKKNIMVGMVTTRKVQALAWWYRDLLRRGTTSVDPLLWTHQKCRECIQLMDMEKEQKGSEASKALHPGKIPNGKGWTQWALGFKNYLSTMLGASGVPLNYVVRGISDAKYSGDTNATDEIARLVNEAVLKGSVFNQDNRSVFQILKNCALGTPSWEWIRRFNGKEDGRHAFTKLCEHYDGPGETRKRLALARKQIEEVHYKSEQTFNFESYVTKLKGAFEVLEECDQPYTENQKVDTLIKGIQCSNQNVNTIKMIVFADPLLSSDFDRAANKISETVASAFPDASGRHARKVGAVGKTGAGRGKLNQRNKGKDDGEIPAKINGVDLSNPFRQFTPDEWNKIPYNIRDRIRSKREKRKGKKNEKEKRNIGAVSTEEESKDNSGDEQIQESATAKATFGSKAYKKSRTSVVVSSMRRISKSSVTYQGYKNNGKITSGNIELDTHADTCCLGSNFVPILYTGQVCDVQPFSDGYKPMENIPVVTGVTAYDDEETGFTYLLEFNQSLWFGDQLEHSLINPNQIRSFGISLCDDPYDEHRPLGVRIPGTDTVLPFDVKGNIVFMKTRTPTEDELAQCDRYIVMTSEEIWNPLEDLDRRVVKSVQLQTDKVNSDSIDLRMIAAFATERHSAITPQELSKKWKIGLETAKNTLKCTTQLGVRHAIHPLRKRYRTDQLVLRYPRLKTTFYTDTIVSKYQSIGGCRFAQVYTNENLVRVYPLTKKMEIGGTLQQFVEEVGVPFELVYDSASEMAGKDSSFQDTARYYKIKCRQTEPETPKQNRAESTIRELKAKWRQRMVQEGIPKRLWDYGMVYEAEIMSRTSCAGQRTGMEIVTGDTPDISEWLDFTLYDWVWVWNARANSMDENPVLARWLGVAHRVGSDMCYWILLKNGSVVARTTVQHVTKEDSEKENICQEMKSFDQNIREILEEGASAQPIKGFPSVYYLEDIDLPEEENSEAGVILPEPTPDSCDPNIGAKVLIPMGGELCNGVVAKRMKDVNGAPVGARAKYPTEDTRLYEVDFGDGLKEKLSANIIAEGIFAHADSSGDPNGLLEEITGYQVSAPQAEASDESMWNFYVHWRDGDASWVGLETLKNSYPIELAEYVIAQGLDDLPVFKLWVKQVVKTKNRIISAAKQRVSAMGNKKRKHAHQEKFGVKVPRSVEEAIQLDRLNGDGLWQAAIDKEMSNVRVAFDVWNDGTIEDIKARRKLVGYQRINCHMIFDVKMDLTRKARFVAGGHMTAPPDSLTYSSVVTRESVRIAFMLAALHDLDVCAADVTNAYLNAKCREKIYCVAGPEFGSDRGKIMVINRALYGLKSSGAAWRALLATTLVDMGFRSSLADPDVWTRAAIKPDGLEYYEMILVYVDDILALSHDTGAIMKQLAELYQLKPGSIGPPKRYLGATISKHQLPDGREVWAMSAEEYLDNIIKVIEARMKKDGDQPFNKRQRKRPYQFGYKPELDTSEELQGEMVTWFQQLIGMLRWVTELGRIDVLFEVSKLSAHNALPRKGHLRQVYNVFYYLHRTRKRKIVFDDLRSDTDVSCFVSTNWSDFYPEADRKIPPNMLTPRGLAVKLTWLVDASHGGDMVTRRSQTGILGYINNSPIVAYSKRQTTVEVSTFGSEFVAMRTCVEMCEALRYKLQMFGVAIDGKIDVLCDNMSVVKNSSLPESVLSKKHTSICYHRVREAVAAGILWIAKVDSKDNLADLLTKQLSNEARGYIIACIHYDGDESVGSEVDETSVPPGICA